MQGESPPAKELVRNAELSPGERGADLDARGDRPRQGTRKCQHIRSGRRKAIYLLPSGVANPARAQLVGKAVQYSNPALSIGQYPAPPGAAAKFPRIFIQAALSSVAALSHK
jgi:hypothetical protein